MLGANEAGQAKESRNTRGYGSVKPFGDKGQWRARLGSGSNRMSKVVATKKEGLDQIRAWQNAGESGTLVHGAKSELHEVIREWLDYEEQKRVSKQPKALAESTLQGYEQKFTAYIKHAPIAHIKLRDLTDRHIEAFINSLNDGTFAASKTKVIDKELNALKISDPLIGHKRVALKATQPKSSGFRYSYSIQRQTYAVIRDALKYAVTQNYVSRNIALDYVAPGAQTNNHRDAGTPGTEETHGYEMDPKDLLKILNALDHEDHVRLKARWLLSLRYGIRPGEVLGICVGDIDFNKAELTIRRQVQPKTGKGTIIVHRVKTPSGKRVVPLDDEMLELLKDRRMARRRERRGDWKLYEFEGQTYDLMFAQKNGNVTSQRLDAENWRRLLVTAKVPHVRRYVARHNAASRLMALPNVDVVAVAAIMGHSDPSFTLKRYSHALSEKKKDMVARMSEAARDLLFNAKEKMEHEIGRDAMMKQGFKPHEWDSDGELIS